MSGETDLASMLATIDVARRPGTFAFVTGDHASFPPAAAAMVEEDEGITWVVPLEVARVAGVDVDFVGAWLTLTVHSSLEAVGLTAAVSSALAGAGIACNMLAGLRHDHLLVPLDRVDDAIGIVRALAARSG